MNRLTARFRDVDRESIPAQLVVRPTISPAKRVHPIVKAANIDDAVDNGW
jgi:hypothetical protein